MKAATERFSDRVENYAKYRPGYPEAALDLLEHECALAPGTTVADLGSGTGIFSALLLARGARVYAVEPNAAMRAAAEQRLGGESGFVSVAATAEDTGLEAGSVDLIVAAQSFHWFERAQARREFVRLLRPGGHVALIWNERVIDGTPFLRGYERILRDYAPEYGIVDHRDISPEDVAAFYAPGKAQLQVFPYRQRFDFEGLKGRLLSSSYSPEEGHPNHVPMINALRRLFETYEENGTVALAYATRVFYGRLE